MAGAVDHETHLFRLPADHPDLMRRYRLPSDAAIDHADQQRREMAQVGSLSLLMAMKRASI